MALFALMVGGAVFEVIGIGAIPLFISLLSDPDPFLQSRWGAEAYRWFGLGSTNELFVWAALGLVLIFLIKNAYVAALIYLSAKFVYDRQVTLSRRLFEVYLRAPYTFHLQRNSAELLRNTNQETSLLVLNFMMPGLILAMELLVVAFVALLLVLAEPVVSTMAVAIAGLSALLFYRLIRARTNQLGHIYQVQRGAMLQIVNEGLGGLKETRVLGRQDFFLRRFGRSATEFARTARFEKLLRELPGPFIETAAVAGLLIATVALLMQGRSPQAIVPTLALFGAAAIRLMPSLKRMMGSVSALRFYAHSAHVVHQEIESGDWVTTARKVQEPESGSLPGRPVFTRTIDFKDVSFTYPGVDRPAVSNISLRIDRGSAVGFVGPSGAGKSTLIDLMLGLLPPSSGALYVDGVNVHARGVLSAWQSEIGYVPQSIFLADTTVRGNIAFGVPDEEIDDDAVWAAIDAAQLRGVVENLEMGIETMIGERGIRLSGGQRQRIGIARALYHRPQVLVLDEATSSLDEGTEARIIETVEQLHGERTIIVIAHRLSTVRGCDQVFRLVDGSLLIEGAANGLAPVSSYPGA